ncbi:MAG TPA: hypothetical protein VMZ91_10240 [Candidatus Paceibacterota bacterium]|nr:hypothetical protein [Candidatus Paceibacterota bacterium]
MIRIRNESDFRNWFKKNYGKLGFSKIVKSSTNGFPDFIMLKGNKKIRVELEIKSSNFKLHNHPIEGVDKVLCIIEDVKLKLPTIKVKGIRLIKWGEKESFYSIKKQVYNLFKKEGIKVLTTSEVASLINISWNTAEKSLLELVIDGKVERIKKEGVNLWLPK